MFCRVVYSGGWGDKLHYNAPTRGYILPMVGEKFVNIDFESKKTLKKIFFNAS